MTEDDATDQARPDAARPASGRSGSAVAPALVHAIVIGEATEEAMTTVVDITPPRPSTIPLIGGLIDSVTSRRPATVPADQVRRACDALDEFADALVALHDAEPTWGMQGPAAETRDWSKALWADTGAGPMIYNGLRSAMVDLHRRRADAVLGRSPKR